MKELTSEVSDWLFELVKKKRKLKAVVVVASKNVSPTAAGTVMEAQREIIFRKIMRLKPAFNSWATKKEEMGS